ncbi:MAG: ubiquinol-cytochrome c reductase iron-sulfur subunit [Nitrospirota bacterium]
MKENSYFRPENPEFTRHRFLKLLIGSMSFLLGLILGIPFIVALVSKLRIGEIGWSRVVSVDSLPSGEPVRVNFTERKEDAYIYERTLYSVWAIKHSSQLTIFSPICPHLGCYYNWNLQTRHFECPCHFSVFSIDGTVLSGPAPRPLDTLPYKVENGILYVKWEEFKVGIPEKVVIG